MKITQTSNISSNKHQIFHQTNINYIDAGSVTYDTDTFLDKNKDFIVPEHISLLGNFFLFEK